jgi:hypothetical protein
VQGEAAAQGASAAQGLAAAHGLAASAMAAGRAGPLPRTTWSAATAAVAAISAAPNRRVLREPLIS